MSNIGTLFFNKGKSEYPIKLINEQFLSIKTFDEKDTEDIDNCIFNKSNPKLGLVFSPIGHVYLTSVDSNGNPTDNVSRVFKNPIVEFTSYYYHNNFTNWQVLNYESFSKFNRDIIYPQFFVSLPTNLGNGTIGSGYILYRDTVYPSLGSYHLLYNPFHRANSPNNLPINTSPVQFANYCNSIQFQDPGCYCSDDMYHRCVFAAANSDYIGESLLNLSGQSDPAFINSLNSFKANCGCNSVCKSWQGLPNIIASNRPNCSESTSNVFCTAGLSAQTQSEIKTTGVNISQNCGINNQTTPPTPIGPTPIGPTPTPSAKSYTIPIIITSILFLAVVIYLMMK